MSDNYIVVIKPDPEPATVTSGDVRQMTDGGYLAILIMSDGGLVLGRGETEDAARADAEVNLANY